MAPTSPRSRRLRPSGDSGAWPTGALTPSVSPVAVGSGVTARGVGAAVAPAGRLVGAGASGAVGAGAGGRGVGVGFGAAGGGGGGTPGGVTPPGPENDQPSTVPGEGLRVAAPDEL